MVGNYLKNVQNLEVLNLNQAGISAIALSSILYLLDYGRVFVRQLHISGIRLRTRN